MTFIVGLALGLGLVSIARPVEAQDSVFFDVVRELATTPGDLQAARARMESALAEWDRQIANLHLQPDTIESHIIRGLAYRQRGRLNEAIREFDAAVALQPAVRAASDVHLLRALTFEASGRIAEASRAYQLAMDGHPTSPGKAYLVLTRARDLDAAAAARARAVMQAAYTGVLAGSNPAESPLVPTLDAVPDSFADTPIAGEGRLARAFALLAAGKFDEATAALGGQGPPPSQGISARARIARAGTAESQGRLADARRDYTAALEGTLAGRHVLYVGIGRLAQVEGDSVAAIDAFEHAVRLNPDNTASRREFAAALVADGRFDDAFVELVAALLIAPHDVDVLAAMGQLLLDTDRAPEAIAPLRRALALKAERYETHYALATALSRAGHADDAAREFKEFDRLSRQAMQERRRVVAGQP